MPRKPKRAMNVVAQQLAIKFDGMLPEQCMHGAPRPRTTMASLSPIVN